MKTMGSVYNLCSTTTHITSCKTSKHTTYRSMSMHNIEALLGEKLPKLSIRNERLFGKRTASKVDVNKMITVRNFAYTVRIIVPGSNPDFPSLLFKPLEIGNMKLGDMTANERRAE